MSGAGAAVRRPHQQRPSNNLLSPALPPGVECIIITAGEGGGEKGVGLPSFLRRSPRCSPIDPLSPPPLSEIPPPEPAALSQEEAAATGCRPREASFFFLSMNGANSRGDGGEEEGEESTFCSLLRPPSLGRSLGAELSFLFLFGGRGRGRAKGVGCFPLGNDIHRNSK